MSCTTEVATYNQSTAVTLTSTGLGAAHITKTTTGTVRGPAGSLDPTFGAGGVSVTPRGVATTA